MKTKLLITGIALMVLTTMVNAQNQGAGQKQMDGKGKGTTAFVDANKNGICNNYENRSSGNLASGGNKNCKGCGNGPNYGMGHRGMRQGRGNNGNFVDTNKNGICDNRETTSEK